MLPCHRRRRLERVFLLAAATLTSLATSATAAPADAGADAKARLVEVAKAYQNLKAYADRGSFELGIQVGDAKHDGRTPASIALVRPNKIRVETGPATLIGDGSTLTTLVSPTRKYSADPAPKSLDFAAVALGPVGSLLLGGPSGPPLAMILGLLLADDPVKAVLDQGETLTTEPDRALDGRPVSVLRLDTPSGATYRLLIDSSTHLVRAIEVTPDARSLQAMFPAGLPVKLTAYRWTAGPITTDVPAETFAVEMPKDFARVGMLTAGKDGKDNKAAKPADDEPKYEVQGLVGKPAPRVSLTLFDGAGKTRTITPSDLAGKVVVIDFWATWCGPCLAELPEVQKLIEGYNKAKKDVVIVALSQDNAPKDPIEVRKLIEATLDKKKLAIDAAPAGRVGLDPSNSVGEAFKVEGYPTVVILDGKGVVRSAHVGFSPEVGKTLAAEIDALLDGKPIPKAEK